MGANQERQSGEQASLGPLQREVLNYVWANPGCTVRGCRESLAGAGREYAYTTVQTVMDALHRKKLIARRRTKTAYHYTARESRPGLLARALRELLARFRAPAEPVMSGLVDALEQSGPGEIEALVMELRQRGHVK